MTRMIATFFYVGLLRPAPGTWGSAAAVVLAWAIASLAGPFALLAAAVIAFAVGLWAARIETEGGDPDPSEIVIDEVAGQWVALLPVVFGAWHVGADLLALYPGWIAAFLLFRLFDIWKPWLVGRADRRHDPLGLMLDDIFAGLFAAVVTVALAVLAHVVLL